MTAFTLYSKQVSPDYFHEAICQNDTVYSESRSTASGGTWEQPSAPSLIGTPASELIATGFRIRNDWKHEDIIEHLLCPV